MNKITIAIDGYSSTGKSTVAKQIAKELGYVYVDSGAMYRAVTLYAIQNGLISDDDFNIEALIYQLDSIHLTFQFNESLGYAEVYLNGENIESKIRTLEVSGFVSNVAAVPEVRQKLVAIQKKLGEDKGVVMDGRDIGTVVFPNAALKIFMTASAEKRAKRRYKELIERGDDVIYDDVLKNVTERDHIDTTRKDSPLVKADDAIAIDNSELTLEEQFEKVLQLAKITIEGIE
ncbi:(d)CMP kinase [Hyunsoonleella pacifica]|uniref:Cytidylate kinase n=1 Tax=Hyunsoonleella pacifica TaxID=1080224 RepID=A0A4Q9FTC1_9FLAO|nr:(d)CMP kinase [Hyunsoonleella pacifica]TBN19036.1 (d)CMP kinase [Hyunsoonleella pacifica]GGD06824.1 cytidylate kinase [Hyunsoonleella pacifica]